MSYDNTHLSHRDAILKEYGDFLQGKAFFEFGVFHGTSMAMWHGLYQANSLPTNFYGFDSFQGLPPENEDENSFWDVGDFSTRGEVSSFFKNNGITIVPGFFEDSLTDELAESLEGTEIGLVHIDCDTYSSTVTVWEWLLKHGLLAKGAIVVYDDWGAYLEAGCDEYDVGEAKAHKFIEKTHGINFTDLGGYVVDPAFYVIKVFRYEDHFTQR